jgi:ParB family chromosome partitioning protein
LADNGDNNRYPQGHQLMQVAPEQIAASPLQPRRYFDPAALEDLANAIRAQGIIEPLVVRPVPGANDGRFELIAG